MPHRWAPQRTAPEKARRLWSWISWGESESQVLKWWWSLVLAAGNLFLHIHRMLKTELLFRRDFVSEGYVTHTCRIGLSVKINLLPQWHLQSRLRHARIAPLLANACRCPSSRYCYIDNARLFCLTSSEWARSIGANEAWWIQKFQLWSPWTWQDAERRKRVQMSAEKTKTKECERVQRAPRCQILQTASSETARLGNSLKKEAGGPDSRESSVLRACFF